MAVTRRIPRRCHLAAVGLAVLIAISLGAAAPASAASGRRCPDRTRPVYDRPAPAEAGAYMLDDGEFRRFDLPGAVGGGPADINNRGDIVGPYVDAGGFNHGFRLDRRGCFSRVDYPGPPRTLNEAIGINDRGQIIGTYGADGDDTTGERHGYVRDRRRFTSFDVPGAVATALYKNNDRGQIVGVYSNESRDRIGTADAHGVLLDGENLVRIDAPGAALTFLFDINDRGQILGFGANAENTEGFGFVRDRRGHYRRLPDVPGARVTLPQGFNNRGQVVGLYFDGDGDQHGYLFDRGRFTTIDVPGAAATDAFGINDRGQMVGAYSTAPVPTAPSTMTAASTPTGP